MPAISCAVITSSNARSLPPSPSAWNALTEARRAVFFADNPIEWATPVLYMRASDGKLFDIAAQALPHPVQVDQPAAAQAAAQRLVAQTAASAATHAHRAAGSAQALVEALA